MNKPLSVDAAALNLMLSELRLPRIRSLWPRFTEQADREGWPAARLLAALTEHENGYRVLFTRTTDLTQRLQMARRDLALESAIAKPDKYHLPILDDFAYATKDQAETSVLFELISARYEQRSMLVTANQPFGQWEDIFPDRAMTLAAIDRLVQPAPPSAQRRRATAPPRIRPRPVCCSSSSAPATSNARCSSPPISRSGRGHPSPAAIPWRHRSAGAGATIFELNVDSYRRRTTPAKPAP